MSLPRRSSGYTAKTSAMTQPTMLTLVAKISQRFGSPLQKAMTDGRANTASTINQMKVTAKASVS